MMGEYEAKAARRRELADRLKLARMHMQMYDRDQDAEANARADVNPGLSGFEDWLMRISGTLLVAWLVFWFLVILAGFLGHR